MKIKALAGIDRIFVTCSMTAPSADIGVVELARAHRRQGYSAVAVHFVIRQDGTVEEGRPVSVRGAAAPTHASTSLQFCLIGGLNESLEPRGTFTPAQVDRLKQLAASTDVPLVFGHEKPLTALEQTLKES